MRRTISCWQHIFLSSYGENSSTRGSVYCLNISRYFWNDTWLMWMDNVIITIKIPAHTLDPNFPWPLRWFCCAQVWGPNVLKMQALLRLSKFNKTQAQAISFQAPLPNIVSASKSPGTSLFKTLLALVLRRLADNLKFHVLRYQLVNEYFFQLPNTICGLWFQHFIFIN